MKAARNHRIGEVMAGIALVAILFTVMREQQNRELLFLVLEGPMPLYVLLRLGRSKADLELILLALVAATMLVSVCLPSWIPFHPFDGCHLEHDFFGFPMGCPDGLGMRLCSGLLSVFYGIAAAEARATRPRRGAAAPVTPASPGRADAGVALMVCLLAPSTALFCSYFIFYGVTGRVLPWFNLVFLTTSASAAALAMALWRPGRSEPCRRARTLEIALSLAVVWGTAISLVTERWHAGRITRANSIGPMRVMGSKDGWEHLPRGSEGSQSGWPGPPTPANPPMAARPDCGIVGANRPVALSHAVGRRWPTPTRRTPRVRPPSPSPSRGWPATATP